MMKVSEIKTWLDTLDDNDFVGIDDDGMSLESYIDKNAYFDIGGIPPKDKPKQRDLL